MPRKMDHRQASAGLAKLAPETMQVTTVRLPAWLLIEVHRWAEEKGLDLASAIRELMTQGLETATGPEGASAADRTEVRKWKKEVVRALRAGQSPLEPFLAQDSPSLGVLPAVLAKLDYQAIYHRLKERRQEESEGERVWTQVKADAPTSVRPLMDALDNWEKQFEARKKLTWMEGEEGKIYAVHWRLSDALLEKIKEPASDETDDIKSVRRLIAARWLVARNPDSPWDFEWDE
jgi:hypothetical protein